MNITSPAAAGPYAAPAGTWRDRHVSLTRTQGNGLVMGHDTDPGPQPTRTDRRWYFGLMATCIGLFVLSWAVISRYSSLAAVIVAGVAVAIPPFAVIVANVASASDRRRR
jgi:hypothetical protein